MISPKELAEKTGKLFFKIVSALYNGDEVFPYTIKSDKRISGSNYSDWKNDLVPLYQQSKKNKGKGFSIDWKDKIINGSRQSVPERIYFETLEDFLYFTGRAQDYKKIEKARQLTIDQFPLFEFWTNQNPSILLDNAIIWEDLLKVCSYFVSNTPPHPYYIRELPISVHSKFIEQNSALLKRMLDILLPPQWISSLSTNFADRYGLKKVHVYTQIRILDESLKPSIGYNELALTLDDAAWLTWLPENVFIIENQVCYLTFPKVPNSVAIFGEGFKSRLSKHLPWLSKTNLYCWFDLDTAGFEMLNMIRQQYPKANSFLMDEITYNTYAEYSVENNSRKKDLPNLQPEEQKLYQFLLTSNRRLEQERISQEFVLSKLQ